MQIILVISTERQVEFYLYSKHDYEQDNHSIAKSERFFLGLRVSRSIPCRIICLLERILRQKFTVGAKY